MRKTDLAGARALITGASRGIGRAIALALADAGTELVLLGRDREALDAVAAAAAERSGHVETLRADLDDERTATTVASQIAARGGELDVLVHAAARIAHGAIHETPETELDAHLRTNLRAPWALTRALLEPLCAARGQVVFINSSIVQSAGADAPAYAASKHALRGFADSLRAQLNPRGVRVLSIYPGRTATATQERLHALEGKAYAPEKLLQPDDVARIVRGCLEMPRSAEVTEVFLRPMQKP